MRANLFFFLSTIPLVPLVFKSLQESLLKTICATQGMHPFYSPLIWTNTVLLRGPSKSKNKIDCQVRRVDKNHKQ